MHPSQTNLQRGNILIAVLWILATMGMLVAGLSYVARGDMDRTRLYRDRARAYWLARAAVERVKYDYAAIRQIPADQEAENSASFSYQFEGGTAECQVRTNSALMSINSTDANLWKQLLTLYFGDDTTSVELNEVVGAILDWRDEDNTEANHGTLGGAESEYYLSLTPPYPARNGPFFSIEELLLVKGITEQMFYGTAEKPGLKEMLTLTRQTIARFDINTCPKGILMAFLKMDSEQADAFMIARQEQYFKDTNEARQVMDINAGENLDTFFMSFRGSTVTIKATAYVNNSPARHTVEEEVQYKGGGKFYRNLAHKDFSLEHVDEMISEEDVE